MKVQSAFPFNGERDYVHGPVVFDAFRRIALEFAGVEDDTGMLVRSFRINQLIQDNATIEVYDSGQLSETARATKPWAEMSCMIAGRSLQVGLFGVDLQPVTERHDSYEKNFVGTVAVSGPFGGSAEIQKIRTQYDLVQAVVEANKQIHLLTIPGDQPPKFRFVYCLGYRCPKDMGDGSGFLSVENLGVQETETHSFTLNSLMLDFNGRRTEFRLAFGSTDIKHFTSGRDDA